MTAAEELFHKIASEIPDVKESKMFGALCFKTPNGKAAGMFWKESLIVKLAGEPMKEALSLDGVSEFAPMDNRTMKGWYQIPFHYKNEWKKFAELSTASVKALPAKEKKAKK